MAHVTKNGEERARNPPRKHLMEAEEALLKSKGCEPMHQAVGASPEKNVGGGKQGQEGGRGWPGKSPDRETPVKYLQARDEGNLNDPWPMPTTGIQVRLPA